MPASACPLVHVGITVVALMATHDGFPESHCTSSTSPLRRIPIAPCGWVRCSDREFRVGRRIYLRRISVPAPIWNLVSTLLSPGLFRSRVFCRRSVLRGRSYRVGFSHHIDVYWSEFEGDLGTLRYRLDHIPCISRRRLCPWCYNHRHLPVLLPDRFCCWWWLSLRI